MPDEKTVEILATPERVLESFAVVSEFIKTQRKELLDAQESLGGEAGIIKKEDSQLFTALNIKAKGLESFIDLLGEYDQEIRNYIKTNNQGV